MPRPDLIGPDEANVLCSFVKSDGRAIAYRDVGNADAPTVVLLHCIGLDGSMWADVIVPLSASFRLIIPDLRGHGGSDKGTEEFGMEDLERDVVDLADYLGVKRFALVGCSVGANIAMGLATRVPDRLSCVVLANSPAHLALPSEIAERICAIALSAGMEALAPDMLSRWVAASFRERESGAGFTRLIERMSACPAQSFVSVFRALLKSNREGLLHQIRVPTLVLAGEQDAAFDGAAAARMAEVISGAAYGVIGNASHLPMVEQTVAFVERLSPFLAMHR